MKYSISISIILLSFTVFSQNPNDNFITLSPGISNIKEIQPKAQKTKGSYYYTNNWNTGTIKLFSKDVINGYPLKYDLKSNQIDIKVDKVTKALSTNSVKEITWTRVNGQKELLRNAKIYDKNKIGLFSVLIDKKTPLLKSTTLKIKQSNYNAAVDVGSRASKYIKTEEFYSVDNGTLVKIKKSKRKILKFFKDKSEVVEKYVNENSLSYKKDYDLAKIFEYYNSL